MQIDINRIKGFKPQPKINRLMFIRDNGAVFPLKSEKLEESDLLKGIIRLTKANGHYQYLVDTFDDAIEQLVQSKISFTWTKLAALEGLQPAWVIIQGYFGTKISLDDISMGAILQWRVAVRAETTGEKWFSKKDDLHRKDFFTQRNITVSEYFIITT